MHASFDEPNNHLDARSLCDAGGRRVARHGAGLGAHITYAAAAESAWMGRLQPLLRQEAKLCLQRVPAAHSASKQ